MMIVLVPTYRVFNAFNKEDIQEFISNLQKKGIKFFIEEFDFMAADSRNMLYKLERVKITYSRHFNKMGEE